MTETKIIPQIEFKSLDEFIKGSNDFYVHFLDDCDYGIIKRKQIHFKRFQEAYPEIEKELTREVVESHKKILALGQALPYEKLFNAYNLMSKLVFVNDPDVEIFDPKYFRSDSIIDIEGKYYARFVLLVR